MKRFTASVIIAAITSAIVTVITSIIETRYNYEAFLLEISPILSAIGGLGAMFAAFFSWKTMHSQKQLSKKQGEVTTFNEVSNLIFTQKQYFFSTLNDLYNQDRPWLKSKKKNEQKWQRRKAEWMYIYSSENRNYLNVYEYACGLYQANALDKELFRSVFKDEIISIYENEFGKDIGLSLKDETRETYEHIRNTYKEFNGC